MSLFAVPGTSPGASKRACKATRSSNRSPIFRFVCSSFLEVFEGTGFVATRKHKRRTYGTANRRQAPTFLSCTRIL